MEIKRLGGHLGANVHGVDLSKPLSAGEIAQIREAT